MKAAEIRKQFQTFFEKKGHKIVSSAPMVIKDDPTLMFTNAGMNQFKDFFLGHRKAESPRVANTQKCLRVSGKHNDLEEVGHDTYHHTMFEMLGNWSFGDYFKEEAIAWAWELLTEVYRIDRENLYATVFGGDEEDALENDLESFEFWKKWIPEERIFFASKKNNFWEMGETGPCGPCTEVHVDLRTPEEKAKIPTSEIINKDHPHVIEIWNVVFIQFNRLANGTLETLRQKHVDTGMGLERLAMVIQGKKSNYDSDLFSGLIGEVEAISGKKYGSSEQVDVAIRVIVDHIRAIAIAVSEGQLPGNAKAGYVIRRILRRAVRYGYTFLGLEEPFLFQLVPTLSNQFAETFPEIKAQEAFVQKVIREEEHTFLRTLAKGIGLLEQILGQKEVKKSGIIPGDQAFELYDTYGFPLDLIQLMAGEKGFSVDNQAFNLAMTEQKDRSRADSKKQLGDWVEVSDGETRFVGYEKLIVESRILKYRTVDVKKEKMIQLIMDQVPFYPEGGGQVGDTGILEGEKDGETIQVLDTVKEQDQIIIRVDRLPKKLDQTFEAKVDAGKRRLTMANHSATHLMHAALRRVLGTHVEQKGSYLDEKMLRFDFSHFEKISREQLLEIEKLVNEKVRADIPLDERKGVPLDEAKRMGAMALFGEKYGERVRMIVFDQDYSVELCGGTHVPSTGKIGLFKITSEGSVAAGVRRIEAKTGPGAEQFIQEQLDQLDEVKDLLKHPKDIVKAVDDLQVKRFVLKKRVEELEQKELTGTYEALKSNAIEMEWGKLIVGSINLPSSQSLKDLLFRLKNSEKSLVVLLGAEIEGNPFLGMIVSESLVKSNGLHAGNTIRDLAKHISGGGGGQPFFATAGGKDPKGLDKALSEGRNSITNQLQKTS